MSDHKKPFILSRDERDSKLWARLMSHWADRLASLRARNDGDCNEAETARIRGQIAELKLILTLNNDPPDF